MNWKGACVIGQSGGPTSVINSSVLGALEAALDNPSITRVFGMAHGIKGLLNDDLYDIDKRKIATSWLFCATPRPLHWAPAATSWLIRMLTTPITSASSRSSRSNDIRYFFYNGGNDSMDTCNKVSKYMMKSGYECRVMGIPKTIDNDLFGTDHCPGFASAAKYIATSCMEIYQDARVYDTGNGLHRRDHGPSRWLAGRCCQSGYRYGRRSGSGLPAGDRLRHEEVPG